VLNVAVPEASRVPVPRKVEPSWKLTAPVGFEPPGTAPPTVATAKSKSQPRGIKLDDDREGGLQAYLVVASREPLPPYREWRAGRGASPWTKLPPRDGVWRSSGETLDPVTPGDGVVRGSVVTLTGQPPLIELCQWAGGKDLVVKAIAFPVKKGKP